jgi:hypothetical protein
VYGETENAIKLSTTRKAKLLKWKYCQTEETISAKEINREMKHTRTGITSPTDGTNSLMISGVVMTDL